MKAHIDVRGPNPLYIKGMIVIELTGCNRDITVETAEIVVRGLELVNKA